MKRPPGLWVLLSAGVLWLSMQDVYGIRATSLIFGKSTTTTTTTTTTEASVASEDEVATTEVPVDGNATKPTLTGNPQIDYIWDPNLPKELNGYNLSDYPFYERVPEDIDFKCDGLHDGFYASVKHKCQVYHHCLFGTRYDFLCANYTAFDQKTFICHFASEVDCANSKRFWHRNDALYIAATTTTIKPFVIHTTTSKPVPITPNALAETGTPRRNVGGHRRPFRRRRPVVFYRDEDEFYYDDFDDDYVTRFTKRPTTQEPRWKEPSWSVDDYEGYSVFKRIAGSRRRPYNRGSIGRRRNKDKGYFHYDDGDDGYDYEDYRSSSRRKTNNRKKLVDDMDYPTIRKHGKRRPQVVRESYEKRKRRPINDYVDEDYDDYDRPKKKHSKTRTEDETRTIIKPVSGTIYDRPRVAPKIKPPVPKNEAQKYAYKPITTTSKYDDYYDYDEEPEHRSRGHHLKDESVHKTTTTTKATEDQYHEEEPPKKNEEYYDDYQDDNDDDNDKKVVTTTTTTTTSTTTTTTTTQAPIVKIEQPLIRLVKRPFLPSRGGNPYTSRGLQPVGARAFSNNETRHETDESYTEAIVPQPPVFNPSPVVMPKSPLLFTSDGGVQEEFQPQPDPRIAYKSKAVAPATVPEKNPLDINANDYDVTLNDALNPTLPNLPVRAYGVANEFPRGNFRPSYNTDQASAPAMAEYAYQTNPAIRQYDGNPRRQTNNDYNDQYSVIHESFKPRQQTQAFYSRY